jgi:hypothetical protein
MRHIDPLRLLSILKDLVLLLAPASGAAWTWFKFRSAHSWPSALGRILSAQVSRSGDPYIFPWAAKLGYTYIVNGEYYAGAYRLKARTEERAQQKVEGWKDRMVVVRYSPRQTDFSTLLTSDQPGGQLGN